MTLYKTILADPPWKYDNKHTGGNMQSGAVQKYPTMSFTEIRDIPIKNIAGRDCVLFLWITTPLKSTIMKAGIVESWGFNYKTSLYWNKNNNGLGFWFRNAVEECLICTRGKVTPFRSSLPNLFTAKPTRHSEKPEKFFEIIEPIIEKWDLNPKIELFARKKRDGWDCVGNDIDGKSISSWK